MRFRRRAYRPRNKWFRNFWGLFSPQLIPSRRFKVKHTMAEQHSLLGMSGFKRYKACPGSVTLIRRIMGMTGAERLVSLDDDPDYTKKGSAAHSLAQLCLENGGDTWEHIGETFGTISIDERTANNVQVYVTHCRALSKGAGRAFIEFHFADSDVHPEYMGTIDYGWVTDHSIDIVDYKNGFIPVTTPEQFKGYAYELVLMHPHVRRVRLWCAQPNVSETPLKWEMTAEDICEWANSEMLPAMERTAIDLTLSPGDHCQFCPAKIACPMLNSMFGAMVKTDPRSIVCSDDIELGRLWRLRDPARAFIKAIDDEVFRRALLGRTCDGTKLVYKQTDRVWKTGALEKLKTALGEDIYTTRALRSPAQIEMLGPDAKKLVKELAYTPESGYTIASADSSRREAKAPPRAAEIFGGSEWDGI